jgi:hypothetical protein
MANRLTGKTVAQLARSKIPVRSVVIFVLVLVLVRKAKLCKRLDVEATAKQWAERVPSAIAANWQA